MSTVEVDLGQYVGLLIKASCTDAAQWPEPAREGAAWLATIRGYETACRKAHGEWDFELLSEEDQLEYDSAAAQLDALLRRLNPEPNIPAEEVFAKYGLTAVDLAGPQLELLDSGDSIEENQTSPSLPIHPTGRWLPVFDSDPA